MEYAECEERVRECLQTMGRGWNAETNYDTLTSKDYETQSLAVGQDMAKILRPCMRHSSLLKNVIRKLSSQMESPRDEMSILFLKHIIDFLLMKDE